MQENKATETLTEKELMRALRKELKKVDQKYPSQVPKGSEHRKCPFPSKYRMT